VVFDVAGGSIGRSSDNDWVLPDPSRYISAHHAKVYFTQGHYVLEDTSTNGVFVNDDERPLSRLGPYRLQNGDVLRLGEYQVVAAIEMEGALQPQRTAAPAAHASAAARGTIPGAPPDFGVEAVPTHIEVLQGVGRAASQTDLGAALKLDELLVSDTPADSGLHAVNAYGQAVSVPPPESADTQTEEEEQAVARRIERLARAAAKARDKNLPALYDVHAGLQTFCRGAGIDAEKLPPEAQTRLLHLAGQLFREALVGLKDLERARHEINNRFRIEIPVAADDPRPSLPRSSIEELLVQILSQHESRRLDAVQWLRDVLEGSKAHERATVEAMREAFLEFVGRFDPAELEARFQRAGRRGKAAAGQTRNWELFVEFYRNLTEMPADHLPHTIVEAFANAYKQSLQTRPPSEDDDTASAIARRNRQ